MPSWSWFTAILTKRVKKASASYPQAIEFAKKLPIHPLFGSLGTY
jgi:hypothetical protein